MMRDMSSSRRALLIVVLVTAGLGAFLAGRFIDLAPGPRSAPAALPPQAEARAAAPASPPPALVPATPPAPSASKAPPPEAPRFDVVRIGARGVAVIAGRAPAGAEVVLLESGREMGRARADGRGEWVILPADPLRPGNYQFGLVARLNGKDAVGTDAVVVVVPETTPSLAEAPRPDPVEAARRAAAEARAQAEAAIRTEQVLRDAETTLRAAREENARAEEARSTAETALVAARQEAEARRRAEAEAAARAEAARRQAALSEAEAQRRARAEDAARAAAEAAEAARAEAVRRSAELAEAEARRQAQAEATRVEGLARAEAEARRREAAATAAMQQAAAAARAAAATHAAEAARPPSAPSQPLVVLLPQGETPRLLQGPSPSPRQGLALAQVDYDELGAIRFAGTAAPGATLRVYVNERHAGDAEADRDGQWAMAPQDNVTIGRHRLRVDHVATAGAVAARIEVPFQRDEVTADPTPEGRVVVQPGANLWRLARAAYGSGQQFTVIYAANREQIRNPALIFPGQVFSLPGGSTPAEASRSR